MLIVRNCDISCANRGVIADIRRVDCLRSNLHQYSDSSDELKSKNYKLITPSYPDSQQVNSIFREIQKEGNDLSVNKNANIRIPFITPLIIPPIVNAMLISKPLNGAIKISSINFKYLPCIMLDAEF